MSGGIKLSFELAKHRPASIQGVAGGVVYYDQTPSHRFTTIVAPTHDGDCFLVLPTRDFFDERLATTILHFVFSRGLALPVKTPLTILEGFSCHGYSFDCIAVLSPFAANQYEHENEFLNERAFVAFPIYHCELSGDESADLIDLIRHDFLPSLDWKRSPFPKVLMAFQNERTHTKSAGIQPRLTTLQDVLTEIEALSGAHDSWIDVGNYRRKRIRIEWSEGVFLVRVSEKETVQFDKATLLTFVRDFVMN